MASIASSAPNSSPTEEAEIFKSLAHEMRRNVIKALGKKNQSSFTDIKTEIGNIDSPTLSYHLKSLKPLIEQKSGQYILTEIGSIALLLMNRIDQSHTINKAKRQFIYANLITTFCWVAMQIIVANLISPFVDVSLVVTVVVVIVLISQINYEIIWRLYATSLGGAKGGWRRIPKKNPPEVHNDDKGM
ncbi:MAG: regulatory protein ArsR [Promethearchaeota archaeon CR_4]|nr:MAG: regulatory protein ArsR [Candidatus Lokiarchaeota archaeon CR_4]